MLFRFMFSTAAYEQLQWGTFPESWQAAFRSSITSICGLPSFKYHPQMSETENRYATIARMATESAENSAVVLILLVDDVFLLTFNVQLTRTARPPPASTSSWR